MEWKSDDQLFSWMKAELFSAVIGDVMDKQGMLHQFLPPYLRPLRDDMVVAGRAVTVLEADVFEEPDEPFGLMLEALDSLGKNDVYICTGSSVRYALWGELMSTRAMLLGGAGAVVDGYSRDTNGILRLGFPVFSKGRYAQDQGPRGKVIAYSVPIEIGGVRIMPGDIIFGDLDGILVIPRGREADIVGAAFEKVRGEKKVAEAIREGMTTVEAFRRFGIM